MRLFVAGVMVLCGLILGAAPASADKPVGGCTSSFELFSSKQIFKMFPSVTQESFNAFDKNGDGFVCGKQLNVIFNPIDNTSAAS
jgi:hypothetical protein